MDTSKPLSFEMGDPIVKGIIERLKPSKEENSLQEITEKRERAASVAKASMEAVLSGSYDEYKEGVSYSYLSPKSLLLSLPLLLVTKDIQELSEDGSPEAVDQISKVMHHLRLVWDRLELEKYALGLAAPQIGIPLKAFAFKTRKDAPLQFFVNPVIEHVTSPFIYHNEGCLSLTNVRVSTVRYRYISITDYFTRRDRRKPAEFTGTDAVAIQHEIDHLDGELIYKRRASLDDIKSLTSSIVVGRNDPCPCGSGRKFKKCTCPDSLALR